MAKSMVDFTNLTPSQRQSLGSVYSGVAESMKKVRSPGDDDICPLCSQASAGIASAEVAAGKLEIEVTEKLIALDLINDGDTVSEKLRKSERKVKMLARTNRKLEQRVKDLEAELAATCGK